jgi:serine protease Do
MSTPSPRTRYRVTVAALLVAASVGALSLGGAGKLPVLAEAPLAGLVPAPAHADALARPVGFADIVEKVKPAVVSVRVRVAERPVAMNDDDDSVPPPIQRFFREFGGPGAQGLPPGARRPDRPRQGLSQGSGFFISADGYAVTNNHVVENGSAIEVVTDDGRTLPARLIGTDPRTDLALLKVDATGLPFVRLAERSPRVGDWVVAVGNPFGLGGTVTAGIVSARGRDIGAGPYDDFVQIDAPVNKGNSGGPSFDIDGNVIGVNTAIFSPSGGSVGIAFAIPAETVRTVVSSLRETGKVSRGWLGVSIQPVSAEIADALGLERTSGALVSDAMQGSPASRAGLRSGDIVTALDGTSVKDARDLSRRIGALKPGTTVKLSVLRRGEALDIRITTGELPAARG